MKTKILYRCYKNDVCLHRTWSMCIDEEGSLKYFCLSNKSAVKNQLHKDVKYFKEYIKQKIYDKIVCIIDDQIVEELT